MSFLILIPNQIFTFLNTQLEYAQQQDAQDPLRRMRDHFLIPKTKDGKDIIYFCGNSLGLQPKQAKDYIQQELDDWHNHGVEGYWHAKNPWISYNDLIMSKMGKIVGAKPAEVIVMNTLTVNLHLMMVSFFRPTKERYKILIDYSPFPSDRYAIDTHLSHLGIDPKDGLIELVPDVDGEIVSLDNIQNVIAMHGNEIALIMIGGVNYYTGQVYDIKAITKMGHDAGCKVGFDLAHAAGNIALNLHEDGPDFAVWCTYKYLNSGPGNLSGCFIHERHHNDKSLHRFAGWWGYKRETRFLMTDDFDPSPSAEGWQLSNPPVIQLAIVRASLDIWEEAGIEAIMAKSKKMTAYLEFLLKQNDIPEIRIITPSDPSLRGCQLSLQMKSPNKRLFDYLCDNGIIGDWREPDVIRVAPVPLYNSYEDVWQFCQTLINGIKTL